MPRVLKAFLEHHEAHQLVAVVHRPQSCLPVRLRVAQRHLSCLDEALLPLSLSQGSHVGVVVGDQGPRRISTPSSVSHQESSPSPRANGTQDAADLDACLQEVRDQPGDELQAMR